MDILIIGDLMRNTKYERIADLHKAKENKIKNAIIAFISGGIVGLLGETSTILMINLFNISRTDASTLMIIGFIFLASLFTALGFFDYLVNICRCGLIIPITGFAHSMTSASIDSKGEGLIYGIGSNMFKLAGSVIVYGIVSAWIFGLIRYLMGGV